MCGTPLNGGIDNILIERQWGVPTTDLERHIVKHRYLPPSPCTITHADGTQEVDTRTSRVWVHKDELKFDSAKDDSAPVKTERMFYVTTKRMADAMQGSANARKQLTRATIWAVYASREAAEDFIVERKLSLCAGIVEQ